MQKRFFFWKPLSRENTEKITWKIISLITLNVQRQTKAQAIEIAPLKLTELLKNTKYVLLLLNQR